MRALRIPCFILLVLLTASLANSAAMTRRCDRWLPLLDKAQQSVALENWEEAESALAQLRREVARCSLWLHVTASHSTVDSVERLLTQAERMCRLHESVHVHEAISELRVLLRQAAEGERLSLDNIL